ncbi:MAG: hypothetical protein LQ349_006295 [Xanthoria aureola]|nr:MAG: hypothetical protein LQ349_006295 [Xanthoria aureola]
MSVASRYSVQASSILLFVSALLLLLSTFGGTFEPSLATKHSSLKARHLPTQSLPVLDISTSSAKSTALPFGRQDLALNFSSATFNSVGPKRLSERAPPREPLAWHMLVCKGGVLLEKIRAAFEGSTPPGRDFSSADLDNGWTTVAPFPGVIPATSLDKYWASAFPESKDKQLEIKSINVKQDKNYQTHDGTQITNPTKAFSNGLYIPNQQLIISLNSLSPANIISKRKLGITNANRDKQLPPLNKLSDILWLNWKTACANPQELRYIARNKIINKQSGSAMDYLFLRDSGKNSLKEDIPFPGLEYGGESEELKALLATPNGVAVAWMLIDHAGELKGRGEGLGGREIKVNIFEVDRDLFMLWDIEAQSPR